MQKYSGLQELPSYRRLDGPAQLAVQLRDRRFTYRQIADELFAGYGLERSEETIRNWFRPSSGRLSAALEEWKLMMAEAGLQSAVMLLKRATLPAVVVLTELLRHKNPKIRLLAAVEILNRTIPNVSPTRKSRKQRLRGEPGIPAEFIQDAYEDRQREPEERVADDETWNSFLSAIRVQNSRTTIGDINRLQPVLVKE